MSKRSRAGGSKSRAAESVMVVEPDVLVRLTISDYLRECGYKVIEAITGEEALKILDAGIKVDVVLAEVKLRGALDGFSLTQRIRNKFSGIDVILTTGVAMSAKKAGELCEEGPLGKPYHPQQVVERLKLLFRRRERSSLK